MVDDSHVNVFISILFTDGVELILQDTCSSGDKTSLIPGHWGALRDAARKGGGPQLGRGTPQRPLGAYLESGKKGSQASSTEEREECEMFRKQHVLPQI